MKTKLVFISFLAAGIMPAQGVNLSGTWRSNIPGADVVRIVQQGNRVDMSYVINGYFTSTISGAFDGHTFQGTYQSQQGYTSDSGWVTSTLLPDGQLQTEWRDQAGNGGSYFLTRLTSAAQEPGRRGTTLVGTNLAYFASPSAAACQAACTGPNCQGWSFVYQGAFPSNPNNAVCYLLSQVTAQVPSACCTSEAKSIAAPPRPSGVDLRGTWTGMQYCSTRNWQHRFVVETLNGDGTASGRAEDGTGFTLRVSGDQVQMVRPSWGVTWTGRLISTASGLRIDGNTPDQCTFSIQQQR
jgi:hypothetical protein